MALLASLLLVACQWVLPFDGSGQLDGPGPLDVPARPDGPARRDGWGRSDGPGQDGPAPIDGSRLSDSLSPHLDLPRPDGPASPRVATGSYPGNGNASRQIPVGFEPAAVIVKVDYSYPDTNLDTLTSAVIKTSTMVGQWAKPMKGSDALLDSLIALTPTGFTVGTELRVNAGGLSCGGKSCTYYWVAFATNPDIFLGTYSGTGETLVQSISAVPFNPEYVMIMPAIKRRAEHRMGPLLGSGAFNSGGNDDSIFELQPGGFKVGKMYLNDAPGTYHYVAWKKGSGMTAGAYAGDGNNNRSITGFGFEPAYVIVHHLPSDPLQRIPEMPAGYSCNFRNGLLDNRIQAFLPDGFQVGNYSGVNIVGRTYGYVAFAP